MRERLRNGVRNQVEGSEMSTHREVEGSEQIKWGFPQNCNEIMAKKEGSYKITSINSHRREHLWMVHSLISNTSVS